MSAIETKTTASAFNPGSIIWRLVVPADDVGVPNTRVLRHLCRQGVVRSGDGGRYWLDETGAAKFVQRRNRVVGVSIALASSPAAN